MGQTFEKSVSDACSGLCPGTDAEQAERDASL